MNAIVRTATPADILPIAQIHIQSWLETYTGLLPATLLQNITLESRVAQWKRTFENPRIHVLVAEKDGAVVGFCSLRTEQTQANLYTLYLLKTAQGQGLGNMLWQAALAQARADGATTLLLWVLETNPTRGFYEYAGGQLEGRKTEIMFGAELIEVSYRFHC